MFSSTSSTSSGSSTSGRTVASSDVLGRRDGDFELSDFNQPRQQRPNVQTRQHGSSRVLGQLPQRPNQPRSVAGEGNQRLQQWANSLPSHIGSSTPPENEALKITDQGITINDGYEDYQVVIQAMVAEAIKKGWRDIELTGTAEFIAAAKEEASKYGLTVNQKTDPGRRNSYSSTSSNVPPSYTTSQGQNRPTPDSDVFVMRDTRDEVFELIRDTPYLKWGLYAVGAIFALAIISYASTMIKAASSTFKNQS